MYSVHKAWLYLYVKKAISVLESLTGSWILKVYLLSRIPIYIHCKKEVAVFPSPAGMSLIKLFLGGNNLVFSRPERVWSVTSRLGTGKWLTLFYSVDPTRPKRSRSDWIWIRIHNTDRVYMIWI
jgi:hypothetical protein